MFLRRLPWQEELAIIDRTMKAISSIRDPEELVTAYWQGIGELISVDDYLAVSRRGVDPPYFLVTRSSRFTEDINPWTQRDRLPKLQGGIAGEVAYANKPVIIDDLPARLKPDDPAYEYLKGFGSLVSTPQYDNGEGLNVTMMLLPPGMEIDHSALPMLHWQSGLFGRGTQNLVLRNQLTEALEALDRELQVVGDIQRSLLPAELPTIPGIDLAAFYQTSAQAGGDYYDFFPLEGNRWGLFIGDVSGHGTPAAVLMAITHAIAHTEPGTHHPPARLLCHLNDHLSRTYTRSGTFVTAFYAVLDPKARTLTYSMAGHNPPRLARRGTIIALDRNGSLPLGIIGDEDYRQTTIALEPGDLLLLYTDGITEAMSPPEVASLVTATPAAAATADALIQQSRDLFGVDRLDRVLLGNPRDSAADCLSHIRAAVADFTHNAAPIDDQTLIALRWL